jgi:hypothetical protein
MAFTEQPPPLPPSPVAWVDDQGRLTREALNYLQSLLAYLTRMGAAIP